MKQPIKIIFACAVAAVLGSAFAAPTNSPQPAAKPTQEAIDIASLIGELEQQQAQMVANQEAIEKRVASIAEELRLAKAMVARAK